MQQEYIEIRGARENNLKNVSLRIPKRKITVFTGVSGSGKSSIVFDTIATEAQRQLYENFSMFVRNFLPRYAQPEADAIENLDMAIVVDQKRLGGGSHSTVGTITDIATVLRLLFSRVGTPFVGASNVFSFNDPQGMCPECNGLGRKLQPIAAKFYDPSKSLNEGAVQGPVFDPGIYVASGFFDNDKKLSEFTDKEMDLLLYGEEQKFKLGKMNRTYLGVITGFTRSYIERDLKTRSEKTQEKIAAYLTEGPCPACNGARLNETVLGCTINGSNIAELSAMEIGELIGVIKGITGTVAKPMVDSLVEGRMSNGYVHGYHARENERLHDQAGALVELLHADTAYPSGSTVLEAGCGVGAQTVTLARRSPHARFVSVDISADSLAQARRRAEDAGLANVTFRQADIFALPFDAESFDHVFVCFVLEHLADPVAALARLRQLLRPGGTITVIEGDHGSAYFHPDSAAAREAIACQVALQRQAGGNALIGRQVYPLLTAAGFQAIQVAPRMVYVDASHPDLVDGFTRKTFTAMIAGVRAAALAAGLIAPERFDAGVRDLLRTTEADGVFCYTFFKGVGTKG
jgi:2-polyprenyl-3-methyl-5-hydroxy-6-metoxy-1,4-benzoquinol methylase